MPADSGKLAEKAQDLVQWILGQALDGIGPLSSASDLADDYKSKPYANDAERVQGLIRWAVAKNAGTGFVTGLGGALTLPVTIPGSLAASLAIQAPMVAAIAEIYGHDAKDDGGSDRNPALCARDRNGGRGQASWSHDRWESRD